MPGQTLKKSLTIFIDGILNVNTRTTHKTDFKKLNKLAEFNDARWYDTVHYFHLYSFMKAIDISENDVFADIGCGLGRVLCVASLFKFKKVIGIDLDKELCDQALRNANQMRFKKAPMEIIAGDALELDLDEITVFYFYSPFGEQTMDTFLENVKESLDRNPRKIQMIYLNPTYIKVFKSKKWLSLKEERKTRFTGNKVTYWNNNL